MKYSFFVMLAGILLLGSCSEEIALTPGIENFKVSTKSNTFKVGEEVTFSFEGNPDIITFYSGEVYNQLEYRGGRIIEIEKPTLSFTTSKPATFQAQENQFSVVVSTDFNGNYSDFSHIQAATWTDITDRFTLSTTVSFIPSGAADISDLVVDGKPLYIAYRYIAYPTQLGRVGTWHVQSFLLQANSAVGPLVLGDMKGSGFQLVEQNPESALSRSKITSTRITLFGHLATPENDPLTETWAVSKAFEVGEIDMGRDVPIAIKHNQSPPINSYTHIYSESGNYKVHFIAKNANVDGSEQVVRELEITITD